MQTYSILSENGESLLEALRRQGVQVSASCNGRGTCGKCRVQITQGQTNISGADRQFFSGTELTDGWRLACNARPTGVCTVSVPDTDQKKDAILTAYEAPVNSIDDTSLFAAIDLGTTTIAAQLIKGSHVLSTASCLNSQCSYGADVVSRSEVSQKGDGEALKNAVRDDIRRLLNELFAAADERTERVLISANTTMVHLFMGYSCDGLTSFPFTPVTLKEQTGEIAGIPFTVLPGISTYVGGDIVSGLFSCGFHKNEEVCLFVDLGTNGEMAIGSQNRILCTSAAAGPAFEGTKLSMATDVVKAMAELLEKGIMDETGLLGDAYFDDGYPYDINGTQILITQKDIRNFQMAKSAIRAGITLLIQNYGIDVTDIRMLYLAGGMGHSLDVEAAAKLGLLPAQLTKKAVSVGNCSLKGAILYGQTGCPKAELDRIIALSSEIILSNEPDFERLYFSGMMF